MKYSKTGEESGGSDTPFITPVDGNFLKTYGITPNDIIDRHKAAQRGKEQDEATPRMKRGNYYEDPTRQWWMDEHGVKIDHPKKGFKHPRCNMVVSLDGLFAEDWECNNLPVPRDSIWELKIPGYPSKPTDSIERIIQMNAQMDAVGCDVGLLVELAQSDLVWRMAVVHRHVGLCEAIVEGVNVFWQHMENDTRYAPTTSAEFSQMIPGNRRPEVHDLTDGPSEMIMCDARQDMIDAAETYIAAKRTKKSAEEMMDETSMILKARMGGLEKVLLPGGVQVDHTTVEYKAKPERVVKAVAAKTSRRLAIREIAQ